MLRKCVSGVTLLVITFGFGFWAGRETTVDAQSKNRVFELRMEKVSKEHRHEKPLPPSHDAAPVQEL